MPYKNRDVRRAYDARYKRERRRTASQSAPRPTEVRVYVCSRFPHLRLSGGVQFESGLLVSGAPAIQDTVEQSPEFGQVIFRVALVP
jgi:hypothetical protein